MKQKGNKSINQMRQKAEYVALSKREREVLTSQKHKSNKQIADDLDVTVGTIETYVTRANKKLNKHPKVVSSLIREQNNVNKLELSLNTLTKAGNEIHIPDYNYDEYVHGELVNHIENMVQKLNRLEGINANFEMEETE